MNVILGIRLKWISESRVCSTGGARAYFIREGWVGPSAIPSKARQTEGLSRPR